MYVLSILLLDYFSLAGYPKKMTITTKNGESWCGTDADVYVRKKSFLLYDVELIITYIFVHSLGCVQGFGSGIYVWIWIKIRL